MCCFTRAVGVALAMTLLGFAALALSQSVISSVQQRPFVIGIIPRIGPNGGVGGVSIDAKGIVARSEVDQLKRLREVRQQALQKTDDRLQAASPLRKVSLRGLQAELQRQRNAGQPVADELQNLAGLVRIQLVLLYPERQDIVLAGPAEVWKVDGQGNLVGQTTGQPMLQLDDLIVALRTARNAATEEGITCSIDPTAEGLKQLTKLLGSRNLSPNEATLARMEQTLGPQRITVTGVPPESHFSQVLVAADFMLKRLSMNLERSPIDDMPSYMELLQTSAGPAPRSAMPRFWLAPKYDPLLADAEGLAYELRGSGVQALTEAGRLSSGGVLISGRGKEDPLAKKWADAMTARYEVLSAALPIFAELRNCIDLAVVAALVLKEDLPTVADCDLSLLMDEAKIQVAQYQPARTVASQASLIRKNGQSIVGVSGGVQVDPWSVLDRVEPGPELPKVRRAAAANEQRWWWD